MNRFLLGLILLTIPGIGFAQNCYIGNSDSTGFDNSGDPIYQNYLLGSKIHLDSAGTLMSLNLIGRNTGAYVEMALYDDNANMPGNLVTTSDASVVTTVGAGLVSLPVVPIQLIPGDYWIMAVYNQDGGHTFSRDTTHQVYYIGLNYGDTIPPNGNNFIGYTGSEFTYFMEVTCSTNGITDIDQNFSIYPNPTNDNITINTDQKSRSNFYITDLSGHNVIMGKLTGTINSIDINELNGGIYFLRIENEQVIKLIKN